MNITLNQSVNNQQNFTGAFLKVGREIRTLSGEKVASSAVSPKHLNNSGRLRAFAFYPTTKAKKPHVLFIFGNDTRRAATEETIGGTSQLLKHIQSRVLPSKYRDSVGLHEINAEAAKLDLSV